MKGLIFLPGSSGADDLILEGTLFGALDHVAHGAYKNVVMAEMVFNTSMTGYQEILTDPSYAGQAVCFTVSHIGNTGVNQQDIESRAIFAESLILSHYHPKPSNHRSEQTLESYLSKNNKIGIYGVDTRRLTLYLRDRGVTPGVILPESLRGELPKLKAELLKQNYDQIDWIKKVTTKEPYAFTAKSMGATAKYQVVAYDYGIKTQLLRDLALRGCDLTVVPADFPASKVLEMKPHGVFLSNGPGDPKLATYAVENVQQLLGKVPMFGVCMGHQVLSLALGAKTYKLKFGHRGGNQPVKSLFRDTVEISAHNHGYAVDSKTLPEFAKVSHLNLNDECCEGINVSSKKAFSVQYHPESSPGPHDSTYLFDQFISSMTHP